MVRGMLSAWALIPGVLLLIATGMVAGLVAMNADDFDRPESLAEQLLILLPLIPITWLVAIVGRIFFSYLSARRRKTS